MATRSLSALLLLLSVWFVNGQECSGWISPCFDDSTSECDYDDGLLNLTLNNCTIRNDANGTNITDFHTVNIAGRGEDTIITCRGNFVGFALSFTNLSTLTVENLTIQLCDQPIIIENVTSVILRNVTFRGFTATVLDVYNVQNLMVDGCTFCDNVNNITVNETTIITPFRGNAGAIAVGFHPNNTLEYNSSSIIVTGSTFINNSAFSDISTDAVLINKTFAGRGGAIALYLPTHNLTVNFMSENSYYERNNATSAGGGIYAHLSGDYANVTLHLKNCRFIENYAPDGAGVEFTYDLSKSACAVVGNSVGDCSADEEDSDGTCGACSSAATPLEGDIICIPTTSIIEDCHFEQNDGNFGGAFKGIQINPFGNNNRITFRNCTFVNNTAQVGAGAYFQSRYSVADVKMEDAIKIENCNFTSNSGQRSIVFMIRNRVDLIGTNWFVGNSGPSVRLVGTLVVFNGTVYFNLNRHHTEGLSGALYLSSFGQMLLTSETTVYFTNNTGSDGAAIVVKSPRVSSSFSRQLYNPQCFLQYVNPTTPPDEWNATMIFAGNKARVGPVMYLSNLAACQWYSLQPERYFESNTTERWAEIMTLSDTNKNCVLNSSSTNECSSDDDHGLIQTEVSNIVINEGDDYIMKSPGENVEIKLRATDEQNISTIAFLQISIDDDDQSDVLVDCDITFEPSIIPVSPGQRSIAFKFRSTPSCVLKNFTISVSAPFAINPVEPRFFTMMILRCLPGFNLKEGDSPEMQQQCECNTESGVLYCSPDQTSILLKDGTWAASPSLLDNRRRLITSPCPAGYCNCTGLQEENLSDTGCALRFGPDESICVEKREGFLCGVCRQTCNETVDTNGTISRDSGRKCGIGVLTSKCRCSDNDNNQYYYLVPLVVLYGIVATVIIVLANYPLPSCLKGILYYIQVSPVSTVFFPERFRIGWEVMDCIASTLALYYPYDFSFKPGLTATEAYGLRYIPVAIVVIVSPITLFIRTRFHARVVFEGVWSLTLLTYSHLVYTSVSIVNCRHLDDKLRWFVNGSIRCYEGDHLGLSFLANISLIVTAALIPFITFIVYYDKIKRVSEKAPQKVSQMANNLRITLTSSYRDNYVFWPVVELVRRFVFITAVVATPGDLTLPLLLILLVFGAHVFVYPYKDRISNHVESFVLLVLITVLMLGNTTAVVESTRDHDRVFYPLLFVPLYVAVLLGACYVIYHLWQILQRRFRIRSFEVTNPFKKQSSTRSSRHGVTERIEVPVTHIDFPDREYHPLGTANVDEDET